MPMIARTLDNKRLSYDGRVYAEIPDGITPIDAAVVSTDALARHSALRDAVLEIDGYANPDRDEREAMDAAIRRAIEIAKESTHDHE